MRTPRLRGKVLIVHNRLMRPPSERARSRLGLCPPQTVRRLQVVSLEVIRERKKMKGNSDGLAVLADRETPLDWLLAWETVNARH